MKKVFTFIFLAANLIAVAQNVGINPTGAAPNTSAGLDVNFTNKGLLIPRVSLTSTTDVITIPSPATSLLVYNTNAAMTSGAIGYWYWNGSAWVQAIGPVGATGPTGAAGTNGTNGATGPTGAAGTNGTNGATGPTGAAGSTGPAGPVGCASANYVVKSNGASAVCSIIYDNGTNVGISTTSPNAKLDVSTGSDGIALGQIHGDNTNTIQTYIDGQWVNRATYAGGCCNKLLLQPDVGEVGIGNAAPTYKLDVTGDINFTSTLKFSGVNAIFNNGNDIYGNFRVLQNNSSTLQDGMYINYNSLGGAASDIRFYANGTSERMRIVASNGNVGIGTAGPSKTLHVVGSGAGSHTALITNLTGYGLALGSVSGATYGSIQGFDGAGAANIALQSSLGGNVGIGTTTPAVRLEISSGNNTEFLRMNRGAGNPFQILFGDNLAGEANAAGVVYFEIGGSESFVMGGHTMPDSDNGRDCGTSAHSWQNVYSYGYPGPSDRRKKENIETLNYGLKEVMQLNPVSFTWKKFPEKGKELGFIAQEVQLLIPELIKEATDAEKSLAMDYTKLAPVLVSAIQEQQKQIDELKKEIAELKKR